ncbi:YheC/YheD family protein [Sporosarcina sp. ACRSL]|uniref:YheC/YheD family protein n=1 Tax=Sporosarcina sp. ACRSL TaxID=2918215 RepID=UPI001EF43233|nr:YheC/YheD family protein [Sporosarcina sp. ACRSL]MCG7344917.1 YheC/YheD family protein [Sporosarcina sp. ACRSL]
MKRAMGKWEQSELLQQHPEVAKHIPETLLYNESNLEDLLNRYQSVYVKHVTTGQGRGMLKIKKKGRNYDVNGFTIQGTPIQKSVSSLDGIHQLLHPFIKLGRESGPYIIQEDIQSYNEHGQHFIIRVHIQKLKNDWVIGGMYGACLLETSQETESGIVNTHRGANVMTIAEILSTTKVKHNQKETLEKLEEIATAAAKVINSALPCREFGMDFGVTQEGTPILLEVNTTPSIRSFAQIENKEVWKRIMEIRKMQNEQDGT